MADTIVPIQSAALKFNEDGELKTACTGGSGGVSTADTATVTTPDISSGDPVLLLAANSDRKGFSISSSSQNFWIMFGGVDGEGVPIETGEEGAITAEHNSFFLGAGSSYESGPTVYLGAIVGLAQTPGDSNHPPKVTELE